MMAVWGVQMSVQFMNLAQGRIFQQLSILATFVGAILLPLVAFAEEDASSGSPDAVIVDVAAAADVASDPDVTLPKEPTASEADAAAGGDVAAPEDVSAAADSASAGADAAPDGATAPPPDAGQSADSAAGADSASSGDAAAGGDAANSEVADAGAAAAAPEPEHKGGCTASPTAAVDRGAMFGLGLTMAALLARARRKTVEVRGRD